MSNRWIGIVAGVGITSALGLAAVLLLAPVEPQVPLRPAEGSQVVTNDPDDLGVLAAPPAGDKRGARKKRRGDRRRGRAGRAEGVDREELKELRRQRREQRLDESEAEFTAEERAEARRMYREDRLVEVNERLDAFAGERDWDPELTEEVRIVLLDTADRITQALTRIARGDTEWDDVKSDVRDFRMQQAAELEALLGPEEFDAFVEDMAFERFSTSPPIRGRLD